MTAKHQFERLTAQLLFLFGQDYTPLRRGLPIVAAPEALFSYARAADIVNDTLGEGFSQMTELGKFFQSAAGSLSPDGVAEERTPDKLVRVIMEGKKDDANLNNLAEQGHRYVTNMNVHPDSLLLILVVGTNFCIYKVRAQAQVLEIYGNINARSARSCQEAFATILHLLQS
ncbi:hypothetical protein OC842_007733 [Tilletia horrida]|uniref:Uncharacterized protein n=1 Tax=Tilletia horrida TaxID=155126 RepID=A0AAN6G3L0_9BASI|nr:hypothetical protein OC842_007733 [Tilletia horrida]